MKKINMQKINRRTMLVLLALITIGFLANYMIYNSIKNSASPEDEVEVLVFKELEAETEVAESDLRKIILKKSEVPGNIINNYTDVVGKRIIQAVHDGEFIFEDKMSERGVYKVDTKNMYLVGIDIINISDALGMQMKIGDNYKIYSKYQVLEPKTISDVTLVSLVDINGREVVSQNGNTIKTINVAVKTEEEVKLIIMAESENSIEFVRSPLIENVPGKEETKIELKETEIEVEKADIGVEKNDITDR